MSHVATAPHECEGNLIFTEHGLSPYWAISRLFFDRFDGDSREIGAETDGEAWTIELDDQKGGIAPRSSDQIDATRLCEFRISTLGNGERKANFHIRPRFAEMRHHRTGDLISTPFDYIDADEGVNVRFSGSNLEPEEYRQLLSRVVQILAREAGMHLNFAYFAEQPHEMSNITTFERYVRLRRSMSPKLVGEAGIMQRLLHLCADQKGSRFEYKVDNEEIVGKNHRAVLPKADAKRLVSGHRYGKQIKHYHPKHARQNDETDPLYHPKVGVLVKKSLNENNAIPWSEKGALRREIEEALVNLLYWSDIPIRADQTTYVPDEHFAVRSAEEAVSLEQDPTPEMETSQEALLVTQLRDLCESDFEILETLVTDGEGQHPADIARKTDYGISTVYRALDRLEGLVENERADISFTTRKIAQEIAAVVDSTERQIENAADRVANLLGMDARQAASSAWQKWCNKYAGKFVRREGTDPVLRIDMVLSRLKSTSQPRVEDVLQEALQAWHAVGRDILVLQKAKVQWRDQDSNWQHGIVSANVG